MSEAPGAVLVLPVRGVPEVVEGDDLASLLVEAGQDGGQILAGDVVVVSSKVVSKALGLRWPTTDRAAAVTAHTRRVVAERLVPGTDGSPDGLTQVVESLAGPVMAAAGVDASNTGQDPRPLLLPEHPDAAAADLLAALLERTGLCTGDLAVVISDTAGRPWRAGQVDLALGSAGLLVLDDLRGATDADGRDLAVTARAVADEVAAAADLVKGKVASVPAAIVRGVDPRLLGPAGSTADETTPALGTAPGPGQNVSPGAAAPSATSALDLVRTGATDWFALGHVEAVRAALGIRPGSADAQRVGIASTAPEPLATRLGRAIALALSGLADDLEVAVDAGSTSVTVTGTDAYAVGLVTARLQVALATEQLAAVERHVDRGIECRAVLAVAEAPVNR